MSKLYPPNIQGTIPAFSGDSLVVPFTMNKTVSQNNIRNFSLKIYSFLNIVYNVI